MSDKPDGTLEKIARSMKYIALAEPGKENAKARELSGGARLAIYALPGDEYHLLISRPKVPPSPTEISVFRKAFAVPHWVESKCCSTADGARWGVSIVWKKGDEDERAPLLVGTDAPGARPGAG